VDLQQGQVHEAEQELLRLFNEDPDDPEVFRMMRQFYNQTGRTNEMIAKLEDEHTNHPRDTDVVGPACAIVCRAETGYRSRSAFGQHPVGGGG